MPVTARSVRLPGAALVLAVTAHGLPAVAAIGPLRVRLLPGLSGAVRGDHVALTFDDGPDPVSTPQFLDALARLQVRATFFVLGSQLAEHPDLGRRAVAEGHELAVHGWTHRPHLLRRPGDVAADLARAHACVRQISGQQPRYWRPPHGILTAAGWWAGRRLGIQPVLWTADGRDWRRDTHSAAVTARVRRTLRPGGVLLLHDADTTSPAGSWQVALRALSPLVAWCRDRQWRLGPLGEHGLPG